MRFLIRVFTPLQLFRRVHSTDLTQLKVRLKLPTNRPPVGYNHGKLEGAHSNSAPSYEIERRFKFYREVITGGRVRVKPGTNLGN